MTNKGSDPTRGKRRTRPLTLTELTDRTQESLRNLHNEIERFDDSGEAAIRQMALCLRQLVCSGDGNRWLQRLSIAGGASLPLVTVTGAASLGLAGAALPADRAHTAKYVEFALGGLQPPSSDTPPAEAEALRPISMSIPRFLNSCALMVGDRSGHESFTWDSLISMVANKLGPVHLDDDVPIALDEIATYRVLGLHPIAYAIRSTSVVICAAGHKLLSELGVESRHGDHIARTRGMWVGNILVASGDDPPGGNKPRSIAVSAVVYEKNQVPLITGPDSELGITDGGKLYSRITP